MEEHIAILTKYNFWEKLPPSPGLLREEYTQKIIRHTGNRLIKVLTGQRRAGKSYILRQCAWQLIQRGTPAKNTLFINLELTDFDSIRTYKDLDNLIKLYLKEIKPQGRIYIFLDEIQFVEDWERVVNSYSQDYTAEYELFISGSNSKMLAGELSTLLSGRYVHIEVYPFGFQEYTQAKGIAQNRQTYIEYMNRGGLPELFSLPDEREVVQNYIASLCNSILLKDIIQRHSIRDARLLEDLFAFLINNASNLVSTNNIANYFKSQGRKNSYDSISTYIGYIEESFLVHRCERYGIKGKESLAGIAKFYANDLAYHNFLYAGHSYGIGYALENLVFLELKRKGFSVNTGVLEKQEIDFVARKDDRVIYIQSTYMLQDEQTFQREYAALERIHDNYEKFVLSLDDIDIPSQQGIHHIKAWNLHNYL